jgi:hypothetical protein
MWWTALALAVDPVAIETADLIPAAEPEWVLIGDTVERWQVVADGSRQRTEVYLAPGADSVFTLDGDPWVLLRELRAVPIFELALAGSGPLAVPMGETTPPVVPMVAPARAPMKVGIVTQSSPGVVVIDAGKNQGFASGDRVRIYGQEEVRVPSLDGDGTEVRAVERMVATGQVSVLEDDRALIDVVRGGRVEQADQADRVEATEERSYGVPVAPERLGDLWEAAFIVRPVLALETLGVGFVNEGWVRYTFSQPWYAQLRLSPIGLGWSSAGNPVSMAALVSAGYDHRFFSVGLGGGWSMLNGDIYRRVRYEDGASIAPGFQDVDHTAAIIQEARLGAIDGLSVQVRNTFVVADGYNEIWSDECEFVEDEGDACGSFEATGKEFAFGGFAARVTIPVGPRTDLIGDGGTGDAGATWIVGGVGSWLRGNGDRGSVGMEVAAGYGNVWGDPNETYVALYGPLVSFGLRTRW